MSQSLEKIEGDLTKEELSEGFGLGFGVMTRRNNIGKDMRRLPTA